MHNSIKIGHEVRLKNDPIYGGFTGTVTGFSADQTPNKHGQVQVTSHQFDPETIGVDFEDLEVHKSISPEHHHTCRPLCPCCGGGDKRPGYRHSKAKSRARNAKARHGKAKHKNHRK